MGQRDSFEFVADAFEQLVGKMGDICNKRYSIYSMGPSVLTMCPGEYACWGAFLKASRGGTCSWCEVFAGQMQPRCWPVLSD